LSSTLSSLRGGRNNTGPQNKEVQDDAKAGKPVRKPGSFSLAGGFAHDENEPAQQEPSGREQSIWQLESKNRTYQSQSEKTRREAHPSSIIHSNFAMELRKGERVELQPASRSHRYRRAYPAAIEQTAPQTSVGYSFMNKESRKKARSRFLEHQSQGTGSQELSSGIKGMEGMEGAGAGEADDASTLSGAAYVDSGSQVSKESASDGMPPGQRAERELLAWEGEKAAAHDFAPRPTISSRRHLADCMLVENDTQLPTIDFLHNMENMDIDEEDCMSVMSQSMKSVSDVSATFFQNKVGLYNTQDRPHDGLGLYIRDTAETPMNREALHSYRRCGGSSKIRPPPQRGGRFEDDVTQGPAAPRSLVTTITCVTGSTDNLSEEQTPSMGEAASSARRIEAQNRSRRIPLEDQGRYVLALEVEEQVRQEQFNRQRDRELLRQKKR